jgi:hypothetical protein
MRHLLSALLLAASAGTLLALSACDKLGQGTPKPTTDVPKAASAPP